MASALLGLPLLAELPDRLTALPGRSREEAFPGPWPLLLLEVIGPWLARVLLVADLVLAKGAAPDGYRAVMTGGRQLGLQPDLPLLWSRAISSWPPTPPQPFLCFLAQTWTDRWSPTPRTPWMPTARWTSLQRTPPSDLGPCQKEMVKWHPLPPDSRALWMSD